MNNVIEEKIFQLQAVKYNYRISQPIRRKMHRDFFVGNFREKKILTVF